MCEFNQIIGYKSVKEELECYCDTMKNPDKYKAFGVKAPRGVLLYGKPGLGKTLFAECFAKESGCTVYTIRKQYSDGKFLDYITNTFQEAKDNAPSVVILDDLDKFSNSDFTYRNTDEYVAVQAGIDSCQQHDVFVFATANSIDFLPDSLLRAERFDRVIELNPPTAEEAKLILSGYLQRINLDSDVDMEELTTLLSGKTCAELEKVINDAGISAAFSGKDKIGQKELFDACIKLIAGEPDSMDPPKGEIAQLIAIHEAGHAVVSEFWKPGSVNLVSIAGAGYGQSGITSKIGDYKSNSMEDLISEVSTLLAGKAAAKVLLGAEDTGCSNDIRNAYNLLNWAISSLCWSGFDTIMHGHDPSNFSKDNRDEEISEKMEEIYRTTVEIICENHALVQKVADALLAQTTITYKELRTMIHEVGWDSSYMEEETAELEFHRKNKQKRRASKNEAKKKKSA